jgi:hypothetical protein
VNESDIQFLARMLVATREGGQISSADARRLSNLSQFGSRQPTTMPEERRSGTSPVQPPVASRTTELVRD